mmetsp:Transcript_39819/g.98462  ORF Transcript_39819/g.98462 Transcript_39819/m.98462 type:complete len:296 (-) Transcript_39819:15-902(-)
MRASSARSSGSPSSHTISVLSVTMTHGSGSVALTLNCTPLTMKVSPLCTGLSWSRKKGLMHCSKRSVTSSPPAMAPSAAPALAFLAFLTLGASALPSLALSSALASMPSAAFPSSAAASAASSAALRRPSGSVSAKGTTSTRWPPSSCALCTLITSPLDARRLARTAVGMSTSPTGTESRGMAIATVRRLRSPRNRSTPPADTLSSLSVAGLTNTIECSAASSPSASPILTCIWPGLRPASAAAGSSPPRKRLDSTSDDLLCTIPTRASRRPAPCESAMLASSRPAKAAMLTGDR